MASVKVSCMVVAICMVLMSANPPFAEGTISCQQVTEDLEPCLGDLVGDSSSPSSQCCGGVKNLDSAASTTSDRQTVCNCLKSLASSYNISGEEGSNAAALPGKCGVSLPYKISTSTNCNRYIHNKETVSYSDGFKDRKCNTGR
jgi:hypothetical protein